MIGCLLGDDGYGGSLKFIAEICTGACSKEFTWSGNTNGLDNCCKPSGEAQVASRSIRTAAVTVKETLTHH
jgi:hypothetical protein